MLFVAEVVIGWCGVLLNRLTMSLIFKDLSYHYCSIDCSLLRLVEGRAG